MTTVQLTTLGPGIYWLDVINKDTPDGSDRTERIFARWLKKEQAAKTVRVLRTAHHTESAADRDWVLFEVVPGEAVFFDEVNLGRPTIAPRGRDTQEEDTRSAPDLTPDLDLSPTGLASLFAGTTGLALALIAIYFLSQSGGSRRRARWA